VVGVADLADWYAEYGYNSRITCRKAQLELARRDERVYSVENDLGLPEVPFDKEFPERYVQAGIAEADLLGIAAGLSMRGKVPFVNTFAAFAALRACEQLRLDIAYPRHNVKVVGYYAGLSGGFAGPTHSCIEDIAITRAIPNLTVLCPADAYEAYHCVFAAAAHDGPVFIRAGRADTPPVHREPVPLRIGQAITLREGEDVTIIATGCLIVERALAAAEQLAGYGIECRVLDMHTLKPLDERAVLESAARTRLLVTYEDHNTLGGLGSAVAALVLEYAPMPVLRIGVPDVFCSRTGDHEEMIETYDLGASTVVDQVLRRFGGS